MSTMLARLDHETSDLQAVVDEPWLDLLDASVTQRQYMAHLARVYGFEAPVESALIYTRQLVLADRLDRARAGLLAQDLITLGARPAWVTALPQVHDIDGFEDPAEAVGWKYVIERPTLLHAAVRRNLITRLPSTTNACAYLELHHEDAPARWHQLGELADDIAGTPGGATRMVDAARTAFARMTSWYLRDHTGSFVLALV